MVRPEDLMQYENELLNKGYKYICGIDEVGRGPLAGPVTCTAIIMKFDNLIQGVNDSKKVSKKKREMLIGEILNNAVAVSTVSYDNFKIDELNILNATKACMKDAIMSLSVTPDIVLVDALKLDIPYPTLGIVHGDALSYSIAAASIVAKVSRDKFMAEMAEIYPQYGFETNMGYGTAAHISALKEFGATPIHRKSFIGGILN
ncbi:MAG: ribonuclease HII [Clostridia bacterium]